jgi:ATP-dependent DNA helicase RecG
MLRVPETRLRPALPHGRTLTLDGHDLLVFEVVPAARAVMVVGDGFPRREGDEVILSSEESINRLKDAGLVTSPEARVAGRAAFADLDVALMLRAMEASAFEGPPEAYLLQRRLADRRGDTLALRNGAVWLFAHDPAAIEHPNLGVRVFRVNGTELLTGTRRNVQDFPWIEGTLPSILERARDLIASLIRSSTKLHDLFFKETPEYPPLAWQEALVNALAHRDYAIESRCSEVYVFEDRLKVISPGGLVPPVTIEALQERRRVHASRNPRVARVLTELGIMRQHGEGIPRMIEEMELSWLPAPELRVDEGTFVVTLRNEPIFEGGDPAWTAAVRALPVGVRQKRALVAFADREFTSGDYQTLNQVDRDLAYRELQSLEEHGLLEADGATRGRRYKVKKPAVGAAGRPLTPLRRLIERMNDAGRITNSDYRDAFDVGRAEARRALAELVEREVLQLVGERRGAHYVPGPRWPPADE